MVGLFFQWYFLEVPLRIKKIWGNYLWFWGRYFAILDLARGFFAPWKGMVFHREKRAFELGDVFSAWLGNIISRTIGAMIRTFFLGVGISMEFATFVFGVVAFAVWAGMFLLIPFLIFLGLWLIIY